MLYKKANAVATGLAVALSSASANGIASSSPSAKLVSCRIVGGAKLPSGAVTAAELCRVIETAVRDKALGAPFTVEVRVPSASALVATVRMKDGRVLPEQNMAISDSVLDRRSVARFAAAIAEQIADVVRR